MKTLYKIFIAGILVWGFSLLPAPAQADDVGCGFTNLLYPTYMGTNGGTATCSTAKQCLGYYFTLTTESDVNITFTQGASNCTLNLYKKEDHETYLAKAWMKPSYSGRLTAGDWRVEACPLHDNIPFKLVVTATTVSSGGTPSTPPPSTPSKKSNGEICSAASDCLGGYCVWSKCRSSSIFCGDTHCDSGESCSNCYNDCGSCPLSKGAGEICTGNSDCESKNCINWVCCEQGKRCCSANSQCTSGQQCKMDYGYWYCVAKKLDGESCSAAADCLGGYCNSGTCASQAATYCGDGACDSDSNENCSSCSSDCGACYEPPPAPYCGDGACNSGETCSSCSNDCGACEKQIVTMEMKIASTVKIKDTGSATEQIKYIFPADVWKKNLKETPLTPKYLSGLSKQINSMLKGSGLNVKSVNVSADEKNRALIIDVAYNKYAAKGKDKIWSAPVLGRSMSFGSSCSPENVTGSFQGDHLVVQANCESTTISTATAELRTKITINQSIYLLGNISQAEYISGNPLVTYKVLPITYKEGHSCSDNDECKSGNCLNKICCIKNKTCCTSTKQCPIDEYCSIKNNRNYCIPSLPDGQSCKIKEECRSGNCGKNICCGFGQNCCQKQGDCKKGEYCSSEEGWKDACRMQWNIGEKCTESAMCKSGFCDPDTWTCEKPGAPAAILTLPNLISLKKAETVSPLITIQNVSRKEVLLGSIIYIENSNPDVVEIDGGKIGIAVPSPKTLQTGKIVSTKAMQIEDLIEELILRGKSEGTAILTFKTVYFVNNQSKELKGSIYIIGSGEHIAKNNDAGALFKHSMLLEEKRTVKNPKTGKKQEYIFVIPEAGHYGEDAAWQNANQEIDKYLANLADNFTGVLTPEIVSFFQSAKELSEAKSQKVIIEKTFRAIAPPPFLAGYDLAGLFTAAAEQQKIEKRFLTYFGAKEFIYIPIVNGGGKTIGYSKALVKQYKGKTYAVKIGDL